MSATVMPTASTAVTRTVRRPASGVEGCWACANDSQPTISRSQKGSKAFISFISTTLHHEILRFAQKDKGTRLAMLNEVKHLCSYGVVILNALINDPLPAAHSP